MHGFLTTGHNMFDWNVQFYREIFATTRSTLVKETIKDTGAAKIKAEATPTYGFTRTRRYAIQLLSVASCR